MSKKMQQGASRYKHNVSTSVNVTAFLKRCLLSSYFVYLVLLPPNTSTDYGKMKIIPMTDHQYKSGFLV